MRGKRTAVGLCVILLFAAALPMLAACDDKEDVRAEDAKAELTAEGVELTFDAVEGAEEYRIYHSPSRYGEYELVSTQKEPTYTHEDAYGYFRAEAVREGQVIHTERLSWETETFGENTYIYAPTDDSEAVNADIAEKFETLEDGQFSSERFAVLFKPGQYADVRMQMGYYTTAAGLGLSPEDVTLGYFNVNAQWFDGNATHNFWRGAENFTVTGDVQWAVSQATSFRRMNILGGMSLSDGGWSSGGYIADSRVAGAIDSGSQQQWFTRNSEFAQYRNDGWSRVFVGCEGQTPGGAWPSGRSTVIEESPVVSEKPFLVFEAGIGYSVFIPALRQNAAGVSWDGGVIRGEYIPLSDFYVARADRDTAATLNAALEEGKHLFFTPGVYRLDEALRVEKAGTVVTGIGLATLAVSDANTDTLLRVSDVGGVNISGLLFDAGTHSKSLMEVGTEKTSVSHAGDRIFLSDLFFRVGGAARRYTSADVCLVINSNDVVCDHFWIWRADHSYGVGWAYSEFTDEEGNKVTNGNVTKNGLVVNGDNVLAYALMVEHFHEYQAVWNGENGTVYFYQSETPYDPVQADWTSHDGAAPGYASYKVSDGVQKHTAYGVGVYGYSSGCDLANAIEAPAADGVYFEHLFTVMLSGHRGGAIYNVINGAGGRVDADRFDRTVEFYYGGQIQETGRG